MALTRRMALAGAACVLSAPVAFAQTPVLEFKNVRKGAMKARAKVAIAAYQINFMSEFVVTGRVGPDFQLSTRRTLSGVDEPTKRRLANEAYADLRTRLTAAEIPLADEAAVRQALVGIALCPDNKLFGIHSTEFDDLLMPTMRVGTAYGANAAPSMTRWQSIEWQSGLAPRRDQPTGQDAFIGPASQLDAAFIIPSLALDFSDVGVRVTGRGAGRKMELHGEVRFALSHRSPIAVLTGQGRQGDLTIWSPKEDKPSATEFATASGGAPALDMSSGAPAMTDTAVVSVNLPVWEGLVRQAFADYNAAIVAAVVLARS